MPDPDRYCAEQAASLRDDWQFSRLFLPAAARPGFTALLALRAEMRNVQAQVTEPGVAAMKFDWWRAEIARGFAGEAQHPVARALGAHLDTPENAQASIDAAAMEYANDAWTEQDFRRYLQRSGGALAAQLALLTDTADEAALRAACELGGLKRYGELLLQLGAMLHAQRWPFPANWLQTHTAPAEQGHSEETHALALLDGMLQDFELARIATRTALEGVTLPPALSLQWALVQRDYRRLRKHPETAFVPRPMKDSALARLWTAWRGAQRSARGET